jgi:glycosyltransferase involved in cell wall biosynthesis
MPEEYAFHILVTGDTAHDGEAFARARLHVQPPALPWTRWRMIRRSLALVVRAVRLARQEKVDVIISYDPLTLGVAGMFAKFFSGAKLVVEINGHIRDARDASLAKGARAGLIRRTLFNLVGSMTLSATDCVKILNREQFLEWESILSRKRVVMFHDYVPTSQFMRPGSDRRFIYCLGYPFYRKGVDILLDAFALIRAEFPEYRLVIMGHCHEPELSRWKARAEGVDNVEFLKPVPYEEVGDYVTSCTILATPSRSEGMGRVFIEAMAAAKPCVGTRVGGIPNVIADGETGLLVEPENPEDLADKLRTLLGDEELRKSMGRAGRRRAETVLSEERYARCYRAMIEFVAKGEKDRNGIIFNGFKERIGERGAR